MTDEWTDAGSCQGELPSTRRASTVIPGRGRAAAARLQLAAALALLAAGASPARAQSLTEADYLSEVPVVLTASRLRQSLHDVPGSMTVIDRDQIRRWGARDVTELLRLVPGYLIGGINGANPVAAYHLPLDEFGIRNLVLVDGRSVYSSTFLGDTHYGMMEVSPDDIERIEVMRGANAAAYGANAMFGVINIVTRHASDAQGSEVAVNLGNDGLRDVRVSHGWGEEQRAYRLSASSKADHGYANAFDDRRLRLLDWRADIRPSGDDDLMLKAGASDLLAGRGLAGNAGDPERNLERRAWYLQGRWQRQLSADEQWQLSADLSDEQITDVSLVPCAFLRNGRPAIDPASWTTVPRAGAPTSSSSIRTAWAAICARSGAWAGSRSRPSPCPTTTPQTAWAIARPGPSAISSGARPSAGPPMPVSLPASTAGSATTWRRA